MIKYEFLVVAILVGNPIITFVIIVRVVMVIRVEAKNHKNALDFSCYFGPSLHLLRLDYSRTLLFRP